MKSPKCPCPPSVCPGNARPKRSAGISSLRNCPGVAPGTFPVHPYPGSNHDRSTGHLTFRPGGLRFPSKEKTPRALRSTVAGRLVGPASRGHRIPRDSRPRPGSAWSTDSLRRNGALRLFPRINRTLASRIDVQRRRCRADYRSHPGGRPYADGLFAASPNHLHLRLRSPFGGAYPDTVLYSRALHSGKIRRAPRGPNHRHMVRAFTWGHLGGQGASARPE